MKKFISVILVLFAIAGVLSVRVPDPQAQTATATPTATEEPTIPPIPTIPPTPTKRLILEVIDDVAEGGMLRGWKELVFTRGIVRKYSDNSWYIEFHDQAGCTMKLWFDEAERSIEKCYDPTPLPTATP